MLCAVRTVAAALHRRVRTPCGSVAGSAARDAVPCGKAIGFNWVETGKGYPFLPESPSNAGAPCTCAGWKIVPLRGDFPFLDIHGIA